ncbi:MAG TPA: FAD-dependent oxidoreductase [Chthoniobacterales bacterium]|jgi:Glycine/D-amino acid oxidases (deaminating)|nr:FAD-dependent oxidoreductase [Chthoniobacterales bacterium]
MATVIVVGAGINGVTSAIELKNRGHKVVLVDPGPLPHSLAASTDISKAVRAAYGPDEDYTAMADRSIPIWREWNKKFETELYHETGVLFVCAEKMQPGGFEFESARVLEKQGHGFERFDAGKFHQRFPAFAPDRFHDGFFDPTAGYAESGKVVATLIDYAKSIGVELRERAKFVGLDETDDLVRGIFVEDRQPISGDAIVMATGAWTPYALPSTKKFLRATGHPVFHLKPKDPTFFLPERFPFFGADISTTGYYGFPFNEGVVKIANHGGGREMSPDSPDRVVTRDEENDLREFLRSTIPSLADAPIVYSRICMYSDTNDGDFWIAPDPERPNLIVATGDCGHGFKFAPILGEIIADAVEHKPNPLLQKFRWRPEIKLGVTKEAARFEG